MTFLLFILLFPLICIALAAPLTETNMNMTTSNLEKRSNYPWIGYYDAKSNNCNGDPIQHSGSDRPKLYQGTQKSNTAYTCEAFSRAPGTMVKVYWGTGNYQLNEVSTFYKPGCPDNGYAKVFRRKDGPGTSECFDIRGDGQPWVAVRGGWH